MSTVPFLNNKTVSDIVREYVPWADEDLISDIMWNETGWPFFFCGGDDPEDAMRLQLARYACRELYGEFGYFDGHRLMDEGMEALNAAEAARQPEATR